MLGLLEIVQAPVELRHRFGTDLVSGSHGSVPSFVGGGTAVVGAAVGEGLLPHKVRALRAVVVCRVGAHLAADLHDLLEKGLRPLGRLGVQPLVVLQEARQAGLVARLKVDEALRPLGHIDGLLSAGIWKRLFHGWLLWRRRCTAAAAERGLARARGGGQRWLRGRLLLRLRLGLAGGVIGDILGILRATISSAAAAPRRDPQQEVLLVSVSPTCEEIHLRALLGAARALATVSAERPSVLLLLFLERGVGHEVEDDLAKEKGRQDPTDEALVTGEAGTLHEVRRRPTRKLHDSDVRLRVGLR
mmetsp:Transcript_3095/g.7021  ORF Transcript_3095/g.7021 Transcript_3095/m.7021 type:complete len:303 (+) Transcript_3095:310-1218(+)